MPIIRGSVSILLIGYRGSGKSTIGRRLADRLWQSFVDTDELIVRKAGKSIREIWESSGEAHFRDLESDVLREACHLDDHVIALGGGAVLREENRKSIRSGTNKVIYLRCDPSVLHARIQGDASTAHSRPALTTAGGGLEEIVATLKAREPIYREVMTCELEVTHLSVDDAVVHIVKML